MQEENSEKSRRIVKNTLVLYVRMFFLLFINIYSSRVILDALGVSDYGVYNVVGGFVGLFSLISSTLTGASSRFINFEMGAGDKERLNVVFSSTLTIQIVLMLIVAIAAECFGSWYMDQKMVVPPDRLIAAKWCFQISVITFCTGLLTVPYSATIVAHEKMGTFAYVSMYEGLAKLGVSFLVMHPIMDRLVYYSLLLALITISIQIIYYIYCKRNFEECNFKPVFDKSLLKNIFSYAGWHVFGNSAGILKNHGVNLVLNLFYGPALNAARGVANQVLTAVSGFAGNFMMAMGPQITQSYAKKDYDYLMKLIYSGSKYSCFLLYVVALPILLNTEFLLNVWLKEVPEYAVTFTRLVLIVAMLTYISNPLITAQNATGNVKYYQIIVGTVQLLNLPLSYIVLKAGASPVSVMIVAIIVELIAMFTRVALIPFYIKAFKAWDFIWNVVIKCFAVITVSSFVPVVVKHAIPDNFIGFVGSSMVAVISSAVCVLYIGCSVVERELVFSNSKKMLHRVIG